MVLLWLRIARDAQWTLYAAHAAAALLAWRFAWHLHLYDAMEYGGANTPPEQLRAARTRYRLTALALIALALASVHVLWP